MKHTSEPWNTRASATGSGKLVLTGADNDSIALCGEAEDARRIVAAVNACAGLSTEALESELKDGHGFVRAFQRERDELLEALKEAKIAKAEHE